MWENSSSESAGMFPGRRVLGPLFLMSAPPVAVVLFTYCAIHLDGSYVRLYEFIAEHGVKESWAIMAPSWAECAVWAWPVCYYSVFQIVLMKILPGPNTTGPVSPAGFTPLYKDNGLLAFAVTLVAYVAGADFFGWYKLGFIYAGILPFLCFLVVFGLAFVAFLYVKGRVAPTSADNCVSGNPVFDFYWGVELYPRVLGVDIKTFTNCRFGMMLWGVMIVDCMFAQQERHGAVANSMWVSAALQLFYIAKFFYWEAGYLRSIDIMHDHAGFYICWGCLVWVPTVYTGTAIHLVDHPVQLSNSLAIFFFVAGIASVVCNYLADEQRVEFRRSNGTTLVWGKKPTFIAASYKTADGDKRTSLLLTAGWWAVARHWHYVPELLGSFFWCIPALNMQQPMFYTLPYLLFLLMDRGFRDDARCASKYGKDWKKYCKAVPYKFIPGVL
jgi:7-dehydrocholesterol reductase